MKTEKDVIDFLKESIKRIEALDDQIYNANQLAGNFSTIKKFGTPNQYDKERERLQKLKEDIGHEFVNQVIYHWRFDDGYVWDYDLIEK